MRVVATMTTLNEVERYLGPVINWLSRFVDAVHIYDDRSTDGTPDVAGALGAHVAVRPEAAPSFLDDESAFRQAAWIAAGVDLGLEAGDVIIAVDADEFFVAPDGNERAAIEGSMEQAMENGCDTLVFPVREVFGFGNDGRELVRTDGAWGSITAKRAIVWQPWQRFIPKPRGGGSVPSSGVFTWPARGIEIVHLGYATEQDRVAKYHRYRGDRAHNQRHVESILQRPTLVPLKAAA